MSSFSMTSTLKFATNLAPASGGPALLVRPMKPLVTSLLLLLGTAVHADPAWESKIIGDVRIDVPTDSKTDVQNTPGAGGAVQKMTKHSFRTHVLDLELVFLLFPPGMAG